MKRVGLTGSIGMGKSATAALFAEAGVPVFDADATVHELYAGKAAPAIEAAFPGTVRDGVVDRQRLSGAVLGSPEALARLEAVIHPLVAEERRKFCARARAEGRPVVLFDIPLLFETGADSDLDAVVVVTAPEAVQRKRVLDRPAMTPAKLDAILARQVPDAEKRRRADFVVWTHRGFDDARRQVSEILDALAKR